MISILIATLIVLLQTATGAFWWRAVRGPSVGPIEAVGAGIALGTAAATTSGVLLFAVVPGGLAWAVPSALTIVALPILLHRRPRLLHTWPSRAWSPAIVALAVSGGLGMVSLAINLRNYPLQWTGSVATYHPDMLFFEALSTSLATLGPGDSIFMSGGEIRYHWFTYAWAGQVAQSAGTEPFMVLTRVLPLLALLGSILLVVAWTQRLTRGRWAPTVAGLLIVMGGYVGATYGTILNFDSPSQSLTTVWMLGLSMALLAAVGRRGRSRPALVALLVAIAILGVATTGGKISSVAVVLAASALVAVSAVVRRDPWRWQALASLATLAAVSGATYLAFIAGSAEKGGLGLGSLLNKASSVQGLNPNQYWWGILVGTALLGLAIVPRWAGVVWLVISPASRWRPFTVYSVGLGVSGLLALLFLSGGLNDTWFALAASAPLSVASAVGLSRAVRATFPPREWRPARAVIVAIAGSLALMGAVVALWRLGPGGPVALRWLGPLVATLGAIVIAAAVAVSSRHRSGLVLRVVALTIVSLTVMGAVGRVLSLGASGFGVVPEAGLGAAEFRPFDPFVESVDRETVREWSDSQVRAAQWLRDHAEADDLTATNITYSPLVPAISGQPMYVSAIQYQAPYGRPESLPDLVAREKASLDFIGRPNASALAPLCAAGVDWLWIDPARTDIATWEPYATTVVHELDVIVLRVNPSACR